MAGAIIGLPLLAGIWYRVAVVATDDWAGAVRAMVNLGRQPLATSIGLRLPDTIDDERVMWSLATEFTSGPYTPETISALNKFRNSDNVPTVDPLVRTSEVIDAASSKQESDNDGAHSVAPANR